MPFTRSQAQRVFDEQNSHGNRRNVIAAYTDFNLLPAAAAAVNADPWILTLGVGTEVVTRAAKGGANIQTQASTPADNDNAMFIPAPSSGFIAPINAMTLLRFTTRIMLGNIVTQFGSFGLSELRTDPDPTATAGEGALFLFDPTEEVTTTLSTEEHANWILAHKVNGVDTFTATGIPVVAATDYLLEIVIGSDLRATYYIDNVRQGVGPGPVLTSGDSVGAFGGVETTAAAQHDFDVRFARLQRVIG